jgi:hypothetical protein
MASGQNVVVTSKQGAHRRRASRLEARVAHVVILLPRVDIAGSSRRKRRLDRGRGRRART